MEHILKESVKNIEYYLADLLQANEPRHSIAKKLIASSFSYNERARALYNLNLHESLFNFSLDQILQNKPAPWAFVIKVLLENDISIPSSVESILFASLKTDPEKKYYLSCLDWTHADFQDFLQAYLNNTYTHNQKEIKQLLEQIAFLKTKNLIEEQSKVIDILLQKQPSNPYYIELKRDLDVQQALKRVEKEKAGKKATSSIATEPSSDAHSENFGHSLKQACLAWIDKQEADEKSLAVFAYNLGYVQEALTILEKNNKNLEHFWFYLDWLMESRQYVNALDISDKLSQKIKDNPELLFSLTYIKAQAFYKLGDKKQACSFMQDIVRTRPNYRDAQKLLKTWVNE